MANNDILPETTDGVRELAARFEEFGRGKIFHSEFRADLRIAARLLRLITPEQLRHERAPQAGEGPTIPEITKTITILLALTACLWAAPAANAAPLPAGSIQVAQQWSGECPACGKRMIRVWRQIRPGQWAWVWWCPEPTCN